jgi:hypothetical protein
VENYYSASVTEPLNFSECGNRESVRTVKMWNTVEGLSRLFYASQWAMAVLGALTAIAIVFSIVVSVRKDSLVDEEEKRKEAAHQGIVAGQNQEISSLKTQLTTAQSDLKDLTTQRSLSPEQQKTIVATLKKSAPQETMIIRVQDLETQTYAEQITEVLSRAGWRVDPTPFRVITHAVPGIKILVRDLKNAPQGAVALQNAFKAAGIEVFGDVADPSQVSDGRFVIWIGPKPIKGVDGSGPS